MISVAVACGPPVAGTTARSRSPPISVVNTTSLSSGVSCGSRSSPGPVWSGAGTLPSAFIVHRSAPGPPRSETNTIREPSAEIAGIASRTELTVIRRGSLPSKPIVQISAPAPAPTTKATLPEADAAEGSEPDPGPPGRSVRSIGPEPSIGYDQTSPPLLM